MLIIRTDDLSRFSELYNSHIRLLIGSWAALSGVKIDMVVLHVLLLLMLLLLLLEHLLVCNGRCRHRWRLLRLLRHRLVLLMVATCTVMAVVMIHIYNELLLWYHVLSTDWSRWRLIAPWQLLNRALMVLEQVKRGWLPLTSAQHLFTTRHLRLVPIPATVLRARLHCLLVILLGVIVMIMMLDLLAVRDLTRHRVTWGIKSRLLVAIVGASMLVGRERRILLLGINSRLVVAILRLLLAAAVWAVDSLFQTHLLGLTWSRLMLTIERWIETDRNLRWSLFLLKELICLVLGWILLLAKHVA